MFGGTKGKTTREMSRAGDSSDSFMISVPLQEGKNGDEGEKSEIRGPPPTCNHQTQKDQGGERKKKHRKQKTCHQKKRRNRSVSSDLNMPP